MADKVKYILLITGTSAVLGAGLFLLCNVFDYDRIYENANIWYKVSTDEYNPGEVVALDMSKGYAFSDYQYIYIVVTPLGSEEQMVVAFPNGGYWTALEPDPFLQALQEEFDSLEDYLRKLESKEIKKK